MAQRQHQLPVRRQVQPVLRDGRSQSVPTAPICLFSRRASDEAVRRPPLPRRRVGRIKALSTGPSQ
jgi:hypothetical protein